MSSSATARDHRARQPTSSTPLVRSIASSAHGLRPFFERSTPATLRHDRSGSAAALTDRLRGWRTHMIGEGAASSERRVAAASARRATASLNDGCALLILTPSTADVATAAGWLWVRPRRPCAAALHRVRGGALSCRRCTAWCWTSSLRRPTSAPRESRKRWALRRRQTSPILFAVRLRWPAGGCDRGGAAVGGAAADSSARRCRSHAPRSQPGVSRRHGRREWFARRLASARRLQAGGWGRELSELECDLAPPPATVLAGAAEVGADAGARSCLTPDGTHPGSLGSAHPAQRWRCSPTAAERPMGIRRRARTRRARSRAPPAASPSGWHRAAQGYSFDARRANPRRLLREQMRARSTTAAGPAARA